MRRVACVLAIGIGLLLSGCGDDDPVAAPSPSPSLSASEPPSDLERYCELVEGLDEAGSEAFEDLESDDNATDADYARAERQFLIDHAQEIAELGVVAPEEIRSYVAVIVASMQERAAGGEQEETDPATTAAEKRVQKYEKRNC